jgi:hypothetical protein
MLFTVEEVLAMSDSVLTKLILHIIVIFVIVVWAVVGLIFWIHLLFRITMVYSAMVVHGVLTNQSPAAFKAPLEEASSFYPKGFRIALSVLREENITSKKVITIKAGKVIAESLWALTFWFMSLFLTGVIRISSIFFLIIAVILVFLLLKRPFSDD